MSKIILKKFALSSCLILICSQIGLAQTIVSGKVIDYATNAPVVGCQIHLKCLTTKNPQFWGGVSNQYGDFNIPVYVSLPQTFEIIIRENGHNHSEKRVISINSLPLIVKPYDEYTSVKNKTEIVSQKIDYSKEQLSVTKVYQNNTGSNNNENDKTAMILNDEVIKLQGEIAVFKEKLDKKEFELEKAKLEITRLENKIDEVISRISEMRKYVTYLEGKVHNAYMRLVDCYCESYEDNSVTIGFNVVDENKNFLSSGMESFRLEVLRLKSVNNNKNGDFQPLVNSESRFTHIDKDVFFPLNRIFITFKTSENEFKNTSNNYRLNIYNKKFDLPLFGIDINSLKGECFPRKLRDLNSVLNNRVVFVKKQVEVKSKHLKLTIFDNGEIDGDKGTLYLNGKIIYPNFEVTKNEIIFELDLEDDENLLVLHAENEGTIPPNTIRLRISDGLFEYDPLILESKLEQSEGVRIVYKK